MSIVAMDCEMVGSGKQSLLARVSIVDWQGSVLLDEYVKPTAPITDYGTSCSRIKKGHLDNGKPLTEVQSQVLDLVNGKILVGHSLHHDLKALGLCFSEDYKRDLAKYGPFMQNGQPQSLRDLARKYLNKTIQEGKHDSVTDAKTAMELYNLVANNWN